MSDIKFKVLEHTHYKVLHAEIFGEIPPGSFGNELTLSFADKIMSEISTQPGTIKWLILDFSEANYIYGDCLGVFWVRPRMKDVFSVVIAKGDTGKAIQSLIEITGFPIPLVEDLNEALDIVSGKNTDNRNEGNK
ncbi:hypothetical protein ACFL35_17485 [Candidatus Riflebacteria bacterium]